MCVVIGKQEPHNIALFSQYYENVSVKFVWKQTNEIACKKKTNEVDHLISYSHYIKNCI